MSMSHSEESLLRITVVELEASGSKTFQLAEALRSTESVEFWRQIVVIPCPCKYGILFLP